MNKISKDNASSFLGSLSKVSGWTGISRIFGLIRDISTTSLLGASVFHDIFVITLKIPNVFRRFFAEGAFNQAFIPIYSDYQKNKNESQTLDFLNSLAGFLITFLFFVHSFMKNSPNLSDISLVCLLLTDFFTRFLSINGYSG